MSADFEVAIIGGGVIGLGIAEQLYKDGLKNIALFDTAKPGRSGATAVSGGIVRVFDPVMTHTFYAASSFLDFTSCPEKHGFVQTGHCFRIPLTFLANLNEHFKIMDRFRIRWRIITSDNLPSELSPLRLRSDEVLVYEPKSGYADPRKSCDSILAGLNANSITIHSYCPVDAVSADSEVSTIHCLKGKMTARVVVFAIGGWVNRIKELINVKENFSNMLIRAEQTHWAGPAFLSCLNDFKTGLYSKPIANGKRLIGVPTGVLNVDSDNYYVNESDYLHQYQLKISSVFKKNKKTVSFSKVQAVDSYTALDHFRLVQAGVQGSWWVVTGMNGISYKMYPEISKRVSSMVIHQLSK